jgi:hypothetical protein
VVPAVSSRTVEWFSMAQCTDGARVRDAKIAAQAVSETLRLACKSESNQRRDTHANDQETKTETAARECNKRLNKKQKGAVSCLSEIRFLGAPAISERLRAGYKMVAASRALTNARSSMPVQCTKRTSFDGLD